MALVAIKCVTDLPESLWVKEDPYLVYNMRVATRCSSPSPANCTFQNTHLSHQTKCEMCKTPRGST